MNRFKQSILSPLGIFSSFVALVEIALGIVITRITGNSQIILTWFIVIFPCLVLIGFFIIVWFKPINLYPPTDYSSPKEAKEFARAFQKPQPEARKESRTTSEDNIRDDIDAEIREFQDDPIEEKKIIDELTETQISWTNSFLLGNYKKALEQIDQEIEEDAEPDDPNGMRIYRAFIMQFIDHKGGVDAFEELLAENPQLARSFEWYALSFQRTGKPNEALSIIERGLNTIPIEDADVLTIRKSLILRDMGNYGAALSVLNDLSINSSAPETIASSFRHSGAIYMDKENPETARIYYLKAYYSAPNDINNLERVAEFLNENKFYEDELYIRKEIYDKNPSSPISSGYLGNSYLSNNLLNLAMDSYHRGEELSEEKQGWLRANIGNLFNNQGLYSMAIENLNTSIDIDSNDQYSLEQLASAMKNKSDELDKLQKLLAKFPKLYGIEQNLNVPDTES